MGVDTIQDLIAAVTDSPYGLTGLSKAEMLRVWSAIGEHIEEQMLSGKGLNVPDLGLFSYTTQKLDLGNRYKVTSTPAFFLSERFSRTHGVRNKKPNPSGSIPVVELNYAAVGQRCGASRDVVKAVLKDILVAVADYIHMKKGCEIEMGVGRLVFRGGNAVMRWKASFVQEIEAANTVITEASRPLTASQAVRRELVRELPRGAYAPRARPGEARELAPAPPTRGRPSTAGPLRRDPTPQREVYTEPELREEAPPPRLSLQGTTSQMAQRPQTASAAVRAPAPAAPYRSITKAFYDTCEDDEPAARLNGRKEYEAAMQTRAYLRERERTMDKQLKDMLEKDAKQAYDEEKREAAERRNRERELAGYNRSLTADKQQRRVMLAEAALQTQEVPILGKRPVTPPPAVRAFEYQKLLEEQINFKNARKRQAIEEEMAYASVAQKLVDKELDEAEERLERETLRKRQEHAEVLSRQMRQQALKREEDELSDDEWEPTIKMREEPSVEDKRAKARQIHEDHMALINERRQAAEAQRQEDALHEQRELDKIKGEQAAETRAARLKQFQTRRMLEESWNDQIGQKQVLASQVEPYLPLATSINLKRQARRTNGQKRVLKRRYRLGTTQL